MEQIFFYEGGWDLVVFIALWLMAEVVCYFGIVADVKGGWNRTHQQKTKIKPWQYYWWKKTPMFMVVITLIMTGVMFFWKKQFLSHDEVRIFWAFVIALTASFLLVFGAGSFLYSIVKKRIVKNLQECENIFNDIFNNEEDDDEDEDK